MSKSLTETFSDHYVVCRECGERFGRIAWAHLRFTHHLTFEEYLERHPGVNLTSEVTKSKMNGENSPSKRLEVRAKVSKSMKKFREGHPEVTTKLSGENSPAKRPDVRAKVSKTMKRYCENPEVRAKRSESMKKFRENHPEVKEVLSSPEIRAKVSESMNRPEFRAKVSGENSSQWRGGISFLPYCVKFNGPLKEKIRNQSHRVCVMCGKSELLNKTRLSVHHCDADKLQGCGGKKWFLVALCRSCNSKRPQDSLFLIGLFWLRLRTRG